MSSTVRSYRTLKMSDQHSFYLYPTVPAGLSACADVYVTCVRLSRTLRVSASATLHFTPPLAGCVGFGQTPSKVVVNLNALMRYLVGSLDVDKFNITKGHFDVVTASSPEEAIAKAKSRCKRKDHFNWQAVWCREVPKSYKLRKEG